MKKTTLIYLVILSILLMAVIYSLPRYYQTSFVLRHTLIFIFFASIIVFIIKAIYAKLTIRYSHILKGQRLTVFTLFTLFTITGLLLITAFMQNEYIERFETSGTLHRCYYFDDHGNYLHGSTLSYECPTLEVLKHTDERLTLRTMYTFEQAREYPEKASQFPIVKEGYILVDIDVTYDDDGRITRYVNETSRQYTRDHYAGHQADPSQEQYYRSVYLEIENDYRENSVVQKKIGDYVRKNDHAYESLEVIDHYAFSLEEPVLDETMILQMDPVNDSLQHFEIMHVENKDEMLYEGVVSKRDEYKQLLLSQNPDHLNVDPPIFQHQFNVYDETIIHEYNRRGEITEIEYQQFRDSVGLIHFQDNEVIKENTVYDRKDFSMSEGDFGTYRINDTAFGSQIKTYYREDPVRDEEVTQEFNNPDMQHFDINPIKLVYSRNPWLALNPMLEFALEHLESNHP